MGADYVLLTLNIERGHMTVIARMANGLASLFVV